MTGPFFGIVPGTFTHSHILNHHRYHNGISDVYSTAGYPRDSIVSFCRYICIWFLYASNVSTLIHFIQEGRLLAACELALATLYYVAIVTVLWLISPLWALVSIGWAFVEGNVLLAMVNWVWHMSVDEGMTPEVVSTTIVRGQEFIFSEEYHAVHHASPGLHWSRYGEMYKSGKDKGSYARAVIFQDCNLFVLWGAVVFKDYDLIQKLVHDPDGELKDIDVKELVKSRLQRTIW